MNFSAKGKGCEITDTSRLQAFKGSEIFTAEAQRRSRVKKDEPLGLERLEWLELLERLEFPIFWKKQFLMAGIQCNISRLDHCNLLF